MKYIKEFLYGAGIMAIIFIIAPLFAYFIASFILGILAAKELAFILIVLCLIFLLTTTIIDENNTL